ncbi:MAG TPA: proline iminopeptidase-family hydrolase [Gaiellaceae bacterium]
MSEGYVAFRGLQTWYRRVGDSPDGKLPVLALHGGPGGTHDYLESLELLATGHGREVVFYDQLGCGKSDLGDESLWTVETYVDEVREVRRQLGLDRVHVFGNSWGGMLALEYALTQPDGVASLVIASSPSSMPQWVEETAKLRAALPEDVRAALDAHEAAGTTDSPEYATACEVFYKRHLCRLDEWPDFVNRSMRFLEERGEVYRFMNGPSEFHVVGTLRDWDVTDRLGEIDLPALVISGEHDEATPAINRTVSGALPRAESVIVPGASHMAHAEDPAGYCRILDAFMSRFD